MNAAYAGEIFQENKWMLWWDKKGDTTWIFQITRVRVKYRLFSSAAPFNLLTQLFDLLMMCKSMPGIKRRVEKPLQVILPIFSPNWRMTILPD